MSDPIQEAIDSGDLNHAVGLLRTQLQARVEQADGDIETIAMLREALAESRRETTEARIAASDEEPWVWSDDDDINETVEGFGHMMVVRITGGHLRALIADAVKADSDATLRAGCEAIAAQTGMTSEECAHAAGLDRLYGAR